MEAEQSIICVWLGAWEHTCNPSSATKNGHKLFTHSVSAYIPDYEHCKIFHTVDRRVMEEGQQKNYKHNAHPSLEGITAGMRKLRVLLPKAFLSCVLNTKYINSLETMARNPQLNGLPLLLGP